MLDGIVWNDLNQLATAILVIVGTTLPVVNPPGDAPLFLRMTGVATPRPAASSRDTSQCTPSR
jgi:hypothetical protein